jgi:hypothetical protein
MTNPLRKLPRDVLANVREFASDRVEPHPTAAMIKSLTFTPCFPSQFDDAGLYWGAALVVSGEALTHRQRKCVNPQCRICTTHEGLCRAATVRTMPTLSRRYEYSDFTRPGGWSYYYDSMWPVYDDA